MTAGDDGSVAAQVEVAETHGTISLIELAIDTTGEKNVVLAGGYGLNCVANYYLKKRFPNINFYVDPVSHDGGTAIGLAKYAWYNYSQEIEQRPLKSVYLGLHQTAQLAHEAYINAKKQLHKGYVA